MLDNSGVIFDRKTADFIDGLTLGDGCDCVPVATNDSRWCLAQSVCDENKKQFEKVGFFKDKYEIVKNLELFMTLGI